MTPVLLGVFAGALGGFGMGCVLASWIMYPAVWLGILK